MKNNYKTAFILFAIIAFGIIGLWLLKIYSSSGGRLPENTTRNNGTETDKTTDEINDAINNREKEEAVAIVAENLRIPWEILFLPDGRMLITQRPGILTITSNGASADIAVSGVEHTGEGGLLGAALHPEFAINKWLYLYYTTKTGGALKNIVARYEFLDDELIEPIIIIDNIPAAANHNGGRIKFGPDGLLYATTGDAGSGSRAQDINSLAGKILRVKDDGGIPEDNPFGHSPVYSYGHRNPQGLAWDPAGRLWATEHGRSGILSGYDELNLVEKGKNYGWPDIQGDQSKAGMARPAAHSGPTTTWAPGGAVFFGGSIFFAGLRGQSLYEAKINDDGGVKAVIAHYAEEFGRLRQVATGPDGFFYVLTSNTDGRGQARAGDDKVIKIFPDF